MIVCVRFFKNFAGFLFQQPAVIGVLEVCQQGVIIRVWWLVNIPLQQIELSPSVGCMKNFAEVIRVPAVIEEIFDRLVDIDTGGFFGRWCDRLNSQFGINDATKLGLDRFLNQFDFDTGGIFRSYRLNFWLSSNSGCIAKFQVVNPALALAFVALMVNSILVRYFQVRLGHSLELFEGFGG